MKAIIPWLLTTLFMLIPWNGIALAETFRVMLHEGSFPPYFFKEGNGNSGTIRDIFQAIAQETGDSFEYVRAPFQRAVLMFEQGDLDIEPMTNPAWRAHSPVPGQYSIPFTTSEEIILFKAGVNFPVKSPTDLTGKSVGLVRGYRYPQYDSYFADGSIQTTRLANETELVKMLLAGRLDQIFINSDFARYQMKHDKQAATLSPGDIISKLDIMIRFHPSKAKAIPRFNRAIRQLKNNGTIKAIYDTYR